MNPEKKPVDLSFFANILMYRWKLWLIPLLIAPAAAFLVSSVLPRQYKSSSKIMVKEEASVNPFFSESVEEWTVNRRMPLIQSILESHTFLESVLRTLGEIQERDDSAKINEQVTAFKNQINSFALGGGVVNIDVTGRSPDYAKNAANTLVQEFIKEMARPQKKLVEEANNFLETELNRVRKELEVAEEEVANFKQKNAGQLPDFQEANLDAYLSYNRALLDAEILLQSSKQRKKHMGDRLRQFNPVVQQLETRLIDATSKLSEMKATFKEAHPAVQAAESEVEELKNQLAQAKSMSSNISLESATAEDFVSRILKSDIPLNPDMPETMDMFTGEHMSYQQASKEVDGLSATVGMLRKRIEDSKNSVKSFAKNEKTLTRLIRDIEIKSKVYKSLLEKFEDSQITRALAVYDASSQVWVLDSASLPSQSIGPGRLMSTAAGGVGGLAFGIFLVSVAEFFNKTFRRREEIEKLVGIPVIGVLPKRKKVSDQKE